MTISAFEKSFTKLKLTFNRKILECAKSNYIKELSPSVVPEPRTTGTLELGDSNGAELFNYSSPTVIKFLTQMPKIPLDRHYHSWLNVPPGLTLCRK